jgi:hypothetical protein
MEINVNIVAVLVAAVAQFIIGAIWYMPLFGKLWGKIHGFDDYDKETQGAMQKQMLPLLALQFVLGFLTAYVLAHFMTLVADADFYKLAFWVWLGFVVPTQIAAVLFGGTKPQWIMAKVMVMAGGSLASVMTAAWIIHIMG